MFGTRAVAREMPTNAVQAILGHASLQNNADLAESHDSGFKSVRLNSVEGETHGDTADEVGKWAVPCEGGRV
jgi:hypothetical protein